MQVPGPFEYQRAVSLDHAVDLLDFIGESSVTCTTRCGGAASTTRSTIRSRPGRIRHRADSAQTPYGPLGVGQPACGAGLSTASRLDGRRDALLRRIHARVLAVRAPWTVRRAGGVVMLCVEVDGDGVGGRPRLTGQDESGGDFVGFECVVAVHLDAARGHLGAASAAYPALAGKR
jgi:hypothetical protein